MKVFDLKFSNIILYLFYYVWFAGHHCSVGRVTGLVEVKLPLHMHGDSCTFVNRESTPAGGCLMPLKVKSMQVEPCPF